MKINRKNAYTLVELLVVISILLFGFSIIVINTNSGDGARLSAAQRILSGSVKAARGQAILKSANTRLIIHNDPTDVDKYRRFIGIIYDEDNDAATESWVAANQGTYLPKGIYFDSTVSQSESTGIGASWNAAGNAMQIDYPRLSGQTGNSGTDYLYYEFNDTGTFSDPNAYLVFRAGRMIPGTGLDFPDAQSGIISALIIRRGGSATVVEDPGVF